MNNVKEGFQATRKERLAYPVYAFGQNLIYGLVIGYLSLFYTDYILLPPLAVSVIFLVAKVWDAVNDPMFGVIVDRVSFRSGKFKPWLRFSAVAVPLLTAAMFLIPASLPLGARLALAAVSYLLWSMAYTVSDVPTFSLLTAMTGNVQERSTILSYGSIGSMLCAIVLAVFLVPRLETVGFAPVAIFVAAVALCAMLILPMTAKERNRKSAQGQAVRLRDLWSYFRGNKYLFLFYASYIVMGVLNVGLTLGNYVYIYCLGSLKYFAVFTAIGVVPLILLYLLMPKLTARFDRMLLYKISVIAGSLMGVVIYVVGYGNIILYGALVILKTVIIQPSAMLSFTFTMDCVEYGHYKTGQRREGITCAIQTFANKLYNAISASLGMVILGLAGFDGALAVQAPGTLSAIFACNCWIPLVGAALSLPILFRYKLRSRDVQVMADINSGKLSREAGEALLSRTY